MKKWNIDVILKRMQLCDDNNLSLASWFCYFCIPFFVYENNTAFNLVLFSSTCVSIFNIKSMYYKAFFFFSLNV